MHALLRPLATACLLALSATPALAQQFSEAITRAEPTLAGGRRYHSYLFEGGGAERIYVRVAGYGFAPSVLVASPGGRLIQAYAVYDGEGVPDEVVLDTTVAGEPGAWALYVIEDGEGRAEAYDAEVEVAGADGNAIPVRRGGSPFREVTAFRLLTADARIAGMRALLRQTVTLSETYFAMHDAWPADAEALRAVGFETFPGQAETVAVTRSGDGLAIEVGSRELPEKSCVAYLDAPAELPRTRQQRRAPAEPAKVVCDAP